MHKFLKLGSIAAIVFAIAAPAAFANSVLTVDENNMRGWVDVSANDATTHYVESAPRNLGESSLELETTSNPEDKAVYAHDENMRLSTLISASYWTYQKYSSSLGGSATMTFGIDLNGDGSWDSNFVYEPYWQNELSPDPAPVVQGKWQQWDVRHGVFWASRDYGSGDNKIIRGNGGAPFYSLDNIKANYPDAVIVGYAVSIGTENTKYQIYVDGVELNGTSYDFEKSNSESEVPSTLNECREEGWRTLQSLRGSSFANQQECFSFIERGELQKQVNDNVNLRSTATDDK